MTDTSHNLPSESTRHISTLHEWDKNPRSITKEGFDRLKRQLQTNKDRYGKYLFKPLLINEDGVVLGGNMRLKALKELGVEDIDVSVVPTRNEQEMVDIALKDNDSAGKTEKDELLALIENFPDLKLDDYAVHFDIPETLTDFMEQFKEVEEDEVPDVSNEPAVSEYGKVYQCGRHKIMCGDATKIEDVEKLMNGQKADMVFTDPPYGVEYEGGMKEWEQIKNDGKDNFCDFLTQALTTIKVVSKEGSGWYVWHGVLRAKDVYQAFDNIGEQKRTQIIWNKNRLAAGWGDYRYKHECCVYRNGQFYGGRDQTTVWDVAIDHDYVHPTQKPIQLINMAVKNSSKEEDNILDVFGGSGSTLIACEQTNRICYGMELDEKYVDVVRRRWVKFTTGSEDGWVEKTPVL